MALKKEFEEENDQTRKKFHMNRRFAKASLHAAQLERFCRDTCEEYTVAEAQAYAAWMLSSLMVDRTKWTEALNAITIARTIYERMAESGDQSLKTLYNNRVEDAEPIVRFCMYNLRNPAAQPAAELAAKPISDSLTKMLVSHVSDALPMESIEWRARSVKVGSEKLRERLVGYSTLQKECDGIKDEAARYPLYEKIVHQLIVAEVLVKNEVIHLERINTKTRSVKSEVELADRSALLAYIVYNKMRALYARNELLSVVFTNELAGTPNQSTVVLRKKKRVAHKDLVRIYTNQVKVYTKLVDNAEEKPNRETDAKLSLIRATRLYYIAMHLSSNKHWAETMACVDRVVSQCATIRKSGAKNPALLSAIGDLESMAGKVRSQVHANAFMQQVANSDDLKNQMSSLSIQGEHQSRDLLTGLEHYDASFVGEKRLIEFPPPLQPVATKPLFFDLAFNSCSFPSLEARKKSTASKGLFGFFVVYYDHCAPLPLTILSLEQITTNSDITFRESLPLSFRKLTLYRRDISEGSVPKSTGC
eukprot:gene7960-9353_t